MTQAFDASLPLQRRNTMDINRLPTVSQEMQMSLKGSGVLKWTHRRPVFQPSWFSVSLESLVPLWYIDWGYQCSSEQTASQVKQTGHNGIRGDVNHFSRTDISSWNSSCIEILYFFSPPWLCIIIAGTVLKHTNVQRSSPEDSFTLLWGKALASVFRAPHMIVL